MMNLLQWCVERLKLWLNTLLAPAEDPRQTVGYTSQRQAALLIQVQHALADIAVAEDRLAGRAAAVASKLPRLEAQARQALLAGHEDLARLLLQRQHIATLELQTLAAQVYEVQASKQRLALTEQRLSAQIEAFRARQTVMAARYSAAETQARINAAFNGVSQELVDLGVALQRAEQKAAHMQARAAALDRMIETDLGPGPVLPADEDGAAASDQPDMAQTVEARLEALKQQIHDEPPSET